MLTHSCIYVVSPYIYFLHVTYMLTIYLFKSMLCIQKARIYTFKFYAKTQALGLVQPQWNQYIIVRGELIHMFVFSPALTSFEINCLYGR